MDSSEGEEEEEEGRKPLSLVERHKAKMSSKPKSKKDMEMEEMKEKEEKTEKLRKVYGWGQRSLPCAHTARHTHTEGMVGSFSFTF